MPSRPAYGTPSRAHPDRLSWPRVLVRMFLVVLPVQLAGNLLTTAVLLASGVLEDRPGLSVLSLVVAGLLTGLALGLVLRPDRDQILPYVLIAAVLAAVVLALLLGLGQMRAPAGTPGASVADLLRGMGLVVVPQTAVALPLWWRRARTLA